MSSLHSSSLTTRVELFLSATNLVNKDVLSQSDPFVRVFIWSGSSWAHLGETEVVKDTLSPTWAKQFQIDYRFEEVQKLRFDVYDHDTFTAHDLIGSVETTLGHIMGSAGASVRLPLMKAKHGAAMQGMLNISAEEVHECNDITVLKFRGHKLDKKDFLGKSDPYLQISRTREDGPPMVVFKTETIMSNLNPSWREAQVSVQQLCNADTHRPLLFEVYDWDKNSSDDLIGQFQASLYELLSNVGQSYTLLHPKKLQKKGRKYAEKGSGQLVVEAARVIRVPSFLDYIRGGCEISLMVAIDFTASNGAPSLASSLHHQNPMRLNPYQAAIQAVGEILLEYDTDKEVPVFGFGGQIYTPSGSFVSHCFPLTFDDAHPEVTGVDGIMNAYTSAFETVRLSGPTLFAPVLSRAVRSAGEAMASGRQQYIVLLIITDGVINDMAATIGCLVEASGMPLSVVIVGVGNADFSQMEQLDGDDVVLSSRGTSAQRDIVQFVPFNAFHGNPALLARETLAEIPGQLLAYMRMRGIQPSPPIAAARGGGGGGPPHHGASAGYGAPYPGLHHGGAGVASGAGSASAPPPPFSAPYGVPPPVAGGAYPAMPPSHRTSTV